MERGDVPKFTRRGAALGLAAAGFACAPEPLPPGTLAGRAVSVTPPKSPWDDQWRHFRANVDKDPTIRIAYYNRGETGGEEQQMFDLRRGRAMLGGPSLQGLSSLIPELTIAMAPYVFESEAEVDYVYDNFLMGIFRPLFEARGLRLMQWVEVGWSNLYGKLPMKRPQDAAGRRLRGSPNRAAQSFLRAINADSIPLASTELVPALQTGLIDGGVAATVFHYFSTREHATDFTLTRHSYDTGAIVANFDWWRGASASQRRTLDNAWISSEEARASVRKLTAFCIEDMKKSGTRVYDPTPEERALWVKATARVAENLVDEIGGEAEAVFTAIQDGKRAFAAGRGA